MVFYFYPRGYVEGKDDWLIYMGKDKFENEDLIKYGLPVDVWFHVDNLSSAHVYLRLPEGGSVEDIPPDTLQDCVQLVKANSIQGCKQASVDVIYTLWSNLKKSGDMDVGQVGVVDSKQVFKVKVEKKCNDILNRLNKTTKEMYPDLKEEKEAYNALHRSARRAEERAARAAEKTLKDERKKAADLSSYKHLMKEENMVNSLDLAAKYSSVQDAEDDFM